MYRYRISFLLVLWAMPFSLFAFPRKIDQIVRVLEEKVKKKAVKPAKKGDGISKKQEEGLKEESAQPAGDTQGPSTFSPETTLSEEAKEKPVLSNVERARPLIDEAIKDPKLIKHPATWYCRGRIYEALLRERIFSQEAVVLLDETLMAYEQVKKLSLPHTQLYSLATSHLAKLWSFYLKRGMDYYQKEDFDQAIQNFTICRRILPDNASPLCYMAITCQTAEQGEKALLYYDAYLQKINTPETRVAVFRAMATIYFHQLKKIDTALSILDTALLYYPLNNELLEEQLLLYKSIDKIGDYEVSLLEAMKTSSQDKLIKVRYAYAYLLEDKGCPEEATLYYQKILKDMPYQYETLRQIALLYYNEAIKAYASLQGIYKKKKQYENDASSNENMLFGVHIPLERASRFLYEQHPISSILPFNRFTKDNTQDGKNLLFSTTYVVYDYFAPKFNWMQDKYIMNRLMIQNTSPTDITYKLLNRSINRAQIHNQLVRYVRDVEKYLKKSLFYLKEARRQNKKDIKVAHALYCSYYYLAKYRSAAILRQVMRKQSQYFTQQEDPFLELQEEMKEHSA